MSWITMLWSMDAAFCFTLAGIYLLVWCKQRERRVHLLFSCSALAAGVIAGFELTSMRAETTAQYGAVLRWGHVPLWILLVSVVWFVHLYLRAGRRWLVWSFCGLRTLALILNFLFAPNLNYREITSLRHFSWWGERVAVPAGVPNPWTLVGQLSLLLLLVFLVDATITGWRRGDRRRALVVGGSAVFFIALMLGQSVLVIWGVIESPFFVSFSYLGMIAAVGYELSYDLFHAAELSDELRESQERLRLAAAAGRLGLWLWDIGRDEIWTTPEGRALFGFTANERLDRNRFFNAVHPEDRESAQQAMAKSLLADVEYEREYRVVLPDGQTRWMGVRGRAERDGSGQAVRVRGVAIDITGRRLAEESPRTSEELNRTVLASLHNQIAILDRAGTITAVNDAWEKFALENGGAAPLIGVGVDYLDVCRRSASAGDGTARRTLEGLRSVLEGASEFFEIEYPCDSPSEPRWFLVRVVPLKRPEGGVVVSHADITGLKQTEEKLRESEARFRTVADAAPVLIWMSGPDKRCTFFNKGWLDFTGRRLEQELGHGWAEGVHREDFDRCLGVYTSSFDARKPFMVEYRLRRSDGEYRWLLDSGTPRFALDGAFLGYIGSCADITARRQAEADHRLRNRELARVDRLAVMGELAASLAHEVNNPVGAMVANASAGLRLLASGKAETAELSELLADIVADGRRAGEVIQGIRNMVRKGEARRSVIQINDTIQDLLRIVHAEALRRDVTVVTEVDPDGGRVMADRVQLLQVLLNLTMNGFEAMSVIRSDARRLVIRAGGNGNGEMFVSVRDTGPGFPGGIGERLFEPFFSTKAEGTGMGLAIARGIVEAHGGTISGENCDDGGACFTVRLPEAKEGKPKAV